MEDSRQIVGTENCSSELLGAPGVPDTIPQPANSVPGHKLPATRYRQISN